MLGCRVACPSRYREGTPVLINIPGLAPIGAQVRWATIEYCGLQFNTPLHPLVVDRVIAAGKADAAFADDDRRARQG